MTPPGFVARFRPLVLAATVRIAREAAKKIEADPELPLWRAIQTGDLDGWNARMVFHRYVWPAPSLVAWDESSLRTQGDRLYLIQRFLSDVAPKRERRGGWCVGVYDGGKRVA